MLRVLPQAYAVYRQRDWARRARMSLSGALTGLSGTAKKYTLNPLLSKATKLQAAKRSEAARRRAHPCKECKSPLCRGNFWISGESFEGPKAGKTFAYIHGSDLSCVLETIAAQRKGGRVLMKVSMMVSSNSNYGKIFCYFI